MAAVSSAFAQCTENNGTVTCEYLSDDNFTVPAGVTTITVEAWGGGGGGGGVLNLLGLGSAARGGGGGGYARSILSVSPGSIHTIIVAEGGSGGSQNGSQGESSSFGTGPLVLAAGGSGGTNSNSGSGGSGGSVGNSIGDVKYAGGNGVAGGGGGAGSTGAGGSATGGSGGSGTSQGGGSGGTIPSAPLVGSTPGTDGSNFGGGGSGARNGTLSLGGSSTGGDGAQGQVVIIYEVPVIDAEESTIEAVPLSILADGTSTSDITVTLRYDNGNQVLEGGNDIFLETTDGILSSVTDNNDGTYSATLTSSTTPGTATVTAYLGVNNTGDEIGLVDIDFLAPIFYSRQTGDWPEANTWTLSATHSGDAVPRSPLPGDEMIIGGDDTVSLTGDVTNDELVQVNSTGTLQMGSNTLSGSGEFELNSGGTLGIGSQNGIENSGGSGNIQGTGTRMFSTGANYIYNGSQAQQTGSGLPTTMNNLTIDNSDGVTAESDHIIDGQLHLDNGIFTMPSGSSLVVDNSDIEPTNGEVQMRKVIDGNKGWRMVTSPVNTSYGDLFNGFVTQGFTGSSFPSLQSNVLWFDETDAGTTLQGWRQPDNISDNVAGGRGHFHYVFDGAGRPDGSSDYNDNLPVTLTATGLEHNFPSSTFEFDITHTPRDADATQSGDPWIDINEADEGWNLVGNPTMATIDWDDSGWTKTNMDNTIYVWDPSAGDFLVWNGSSGSLGTGLIAPFQAFWVRSNSGSSELSFTDAVKTTGGDFVGSTAKISEGVAGNSVSLPFTLSTGEMQTKSYISFMEEAESGRDPWDAYRLQPMSETWLALFTTSPAADLPLVINNLPLHPEQEIILPLYIAGEMAGKSLSGSFNLKWEIPENWPSDFYATLLDHEKDKAISLHEESEYQFNFSTPSFTAKNTSAMEEIDTDHKSDNTTASKQQLFPGPPEFVMFKPKHLSNLRLKGDSDTRFSIRLSSSNENGDYIPDKVSLHQNYPNPFNPATTIRFSIPRQTEVRLEVFDLLGRRITTLANSVFSAGVHQVEWDASDQSSGVYLYRIVTQETTITEKMILLK